MQLHELADAAELIVRWVVGVILADVLASKGATVLDKDVLSELEGAPIDRPSFGTWLTLHDVLSRQLPKESRLCSRPASWATVYESGEDDGGEGTIETSLFVLRNRLAHGGSFHADAAARLAPTHRDRLLSLVRDVAAATNDRELVGQHGGRTYMLRGVSPKPWPESRPVPHLENGLYLLGRSSDCVSLAPLLRFAPVAPTLESASTSEPFAQAYFRGTRHAAQFTPLASDHLQSFTRDVRALRRVFGLDRPRASPGAPDWLLECQQRAECLAREEEVTRIKKWIKECDPRSSLRRVAWIHGRPGIGKSTIVARVAADQANTKPERQALYYHAFLRGDWRCSRRALLLGLEGVLASWAPLDEIVDPSLAIGADGERLRQSVLKRLGAVVRLRSRDPRQPPPRVLIVIDGLEEIAGVDPSFPSLLAELSVPGVVLVVSGRSERGLAEWASTSPEVQQLFSGDGLPPISAAGVRAMLRAEGLDVASQDRDLQAGAVENPLVTRVLQLARGIPAYVRLLAVELRQAGATLREGQLPRSLSDYHAALLERLGVSTARSDLTRVVTLLARAREPLDATELAALCNDDPSCSETEDAQDIEAAIQLGAVLFARALTRDGMEAWSLDDPTLRETLMASGSSPRPLMRALDRATRSLARSASWWSEPLSPRLRRHVFRHGVTYELDRGGRDAVERVAVALGAPEYLLARLQALEPHESTDLLRDLRTVRALRPDDPEVAESLGYWEAVVSSCIHWLRRIVAGLGPHAALLQAALESDVPAVTRAALRWLERRPELMTLRERQGAAKTSAAARPLVFEGHDGAIEGALALGADQCLSWSTDGTIRIWDLSSGECLRTLVSAHGSSDGACVIGGAVLGWSVAAPAIDRWIGSERTALGGQGDPLLGVRTVGDGTAASWSEDGGISIWDVARGEPRAHLRGHVGNVNGVLALDHGLLASWGDDETARVWDMTTGEDVAILEGHTGPILGLLRLDDRRLVTWSKDATLALWDDVTFELLARLPAHGSAVVGAMLVLPGVIAFWSADGQVCTWELESEDHSSGAHRCMPPGHRFEVLGGVRCAGHRFATWATHDPAVRVWSSEGTSSAASAGELRGEGQVTALARIGVLLATGSADATIRLWDPSRLSCVGVLTGHEAAVVGVEALAGDRLLSWSEDGTLRLWSVRDDGSAPIPAPFDPYLGAMQIGERIVAWQQSGTIRVLDQPWSVEEQRVLGRHEQAVSGAVGLVDGRLATWSSDRTVRIWRLGASPAPPLVLRGLDGEVQGAVEARPDRLVAWSRGTVQLWALDTPDHAISLDGHDDEVLGVMQLSGGMLASRSRDTTIRLWDPRTGAAMAVLRGHDGPVEHLLELAPGVLVSGARDGTVRVWSQAAPDAHVALDTGGAPILGIRPLSGGRVAVWSEDRRVRVLAITSTAVSIATLGPHALPILDVTALGTELLVWTARTVDRWDLNPRAERESASVAEVHAARPTWGWSRAAANTPSCIAGTAYAWSSERTLGIAWTDAPGQLVGWHADGKPHVHLLSPGGLVVALESGQLRILALHRGSAPYAP